MERIVVGKEKLDGIVSSIIIDERCIKNMGILNTKVHWMETTTLEEYSITLALRLLYEYGDEYLFTHSIGVACNPMLTTAEEITVALLHDVLESTKLTVKMLRDAGVTISIINSVIMLTRTDVLTYGEYITNIALSRSPMVINVKIADIEWNSIPEIRDDEHKLTFSALKRYTVSKDVLTRALRILSEDGDLIYELLDNEVFRTNGVVSFIKGKADE